MPAQQHHHSASQFPFLSSHPDSSSRTLRPPSQGSRRHSRLSSSENRHRSSSQSPPQSDRARHWQTILGRQPDPNDQSHHYSHREMSNGSSSSSPTTTTMSRSKSSSHSSSSKRRLQVDGSTYDSSSRSGRTAPPKPFACQQCERRFERIGHLRSHVDAVHNLRQPYVCHYHSCGKTFSHRSSLCRHVKGVHEKHRHHDKAASRTSRQAPTPGPFGINSFIGTRS